MGFWNDTGMSSHTIRSVHAQKRALLKATSVSHGTTCEHGRVFPHSPVLWNPAKRDLVANVQENYGFILAVGRKAEMLVLLGSAARLPSPGLKTTALRRVSVKSRMIASSRQLGLSRLLLACCQLARSRGRIELCQSHL